MGILQMNHKLSLILCILIAVVIIVLPVFSQNQVNKQRTLQKTNVQNQKETDRANKAALQQKMKSYMADINNALKDTGKDITPPIDIDDATDISKHDTIYSDKRLPKPIYAYSNINDLNMRSESNSKSLIIDKIAFAEKVQIIGKTSDNETINKISAPWLLVRKSNGYEGWVFGGYLQKVVPDKKGTSNKKTDKEDKEKEENKEESFVSKLDIPVEGKLSSNFGTRINPITKKSTSFHSGIDFAAPLGTPVHSAEGGTITKAEFNKSGYGNLIIVQHSENLTTYYGHLSKISVKINQKVNKGQFIGEVGSTGNSTGPHLHFEVRSGGIALDPNEFIR
jgi:murein DD-endopeptidase MepM/ murein hydrolase activator NlpD